MKNILSVSVAFFIAIVIFSACENQGPFSPADNANQFAASDIDISGQMVLKDGPLTFEQLNNIKAPIEKIRIAEHDLKILRSKSGISLQKRFISDWFIPKGSSGWVYAGDEEHGKCWLYFPQFAMDQSTTITMDWESTGFLEGGAEFSPHGVQFNHPLTVWISYKDADLGGIDEEDLKIWYFHEDTETWELIGDTVDTENKMVGGVLHHFSRYAIATE